MFREAKGENDIGKHRFSLCCILNLHVLSNMMLPSMCAFPLCAVNCITYEKKKRDLSPVKKKQHKNWYLAFGLVQVVQDSELYSSAGKEDLTPEDLMGAKKSHPCVKMQLLLHQRCFHWMCDTPPPFATACCSR